jgi:flagellar motor switch protein FliN/FliY
MANPNAQSVAADDQGLHQADEISTAVQPKQAGPDATPSEQSLNGRTHASYEFSDLNQSAKAKAPADMDFILDVPLEISVELGKTRMQIHELLKLSQGSIIELTKTAGESLEILANRRLIARGEVVVANEKYGIRVTEIISPMERVEKLK